ncbi:hypothetical protein GOBAR_DD14704 [Gossypium barbadense]|nr:hypothetical protein GOBAR_DD14704 [Gossypium barbadense]
MGALLILLFFCVIFSSKKSTKGKRPGKRGNRFWKSIGLGFKAPREAIEGSFSFKLEPGPVLVQFLA